MADGCIRRQPFELDLVIMVWPALVVVMKTLTVMYGSAANCNAFTRVSPSLSYTTFVPLPVEALAAIGRALSRHR
jgi:hypothetical protein